MIKVLHVIPAVAFSYGGPSQAVLEMCRALTAQGIKAEIATTSADAKNDLNVPLEKMVLYEGVPVYFFKRTLRSEYKFSWPMTRWLARNVSDYDLLHIHSIFNYPATAAVALARRNKVSYILRPLGMLEDWPLRQNRFVKMAYLNLIEKASINHASILHYTSEEEKSASERLGFSAPGIVIPLGISTASEDGTPAKGDFRDRHPACRGKKLVVFLSRIHPKKGLELLIDALSNLRRIRDDFFFVIAGSGDPAYEGRIKERVRNGSLMPQTLFTGFLEGEKKNALLNDADLFVLPSYQENFGLAVVEAMARGVPVVVSNRVNISHEIESAGAGITVPCEAPKLGEAIQTLLNDEKKRRAMGEGAKRLVSEKFNSREMAGRLTRLYDFLLSRK